MTIQILKFLSDCNLEFDRYYMKFKILLPKCGEYQAQDLVSGLNYFKKYNELILV